jgi:hypothetical protein
MSQTKIILDRQSDLILTSPSITTPVGIVAADISDATNATDVQSTLDSLDTSINNINTNISDNYTELSNTISQEVSTLSTEISSVESTLSGAISQEVSDRGFVQGQLESADTSLSTAISNEVSDRQSADESLSTEISTQIHNLVDGAPSILDTLNELAAAINGDASFATTVTSAQGSLSTAISNEVSDRESADTSLSTVISQEVSDRESSYTTLSTAISQEVSDRGFVQGQLETADTSLSTAISQEVSDRESADTSLSSAISTEISNRESADASLSSEIVAMPDVDGTTIEVDGVDNLIKLMDTVAAPTSGVRTFAGKVALNSTPASFDSLDLITKEYLSSEISTEISSRESADTSLSTQISSQISALVDGAPSILDTLYELANAIDNDASFAATITSSQGSLSSAISTEISDRESADTSLSSAISTEMSDRESSYTTLSTAISQEVSDRGFVQGQLETADTSLSSAISTEISNRESADTSLSTALSAEISNRESAEADLGERIDDALSNLDFSEIDSIAEVLNTFYQKVAYTGSINGTNTTYTPSYLLKDGSESVFLNGLLQDRGTDYSATSSNGKISAITFSIDAPEVGDKIAVYGITNTSVNSPYNPGV